MSVSKHLFYFLLLYIYTYFMHVFAAGFGVRPAEHRMLRGMVMYFYHATLHYTSAVYAVIVRLFVYLSVRVFVTSRSSTKMVKRRILQTTPYDSSWTLVCWCQRFLRNTNGATSTGAPNTGRVGKNWQFSTIYSTNILLYLRNGAR